MRTTHEVELGTSIISIGSAMDPSFDGNVFHVKDHRGFTRILAMPNGAGSSRHVGAREAMNKGARGRNAKRAAFYHRQRSGR